MSGNPVFITAGIGFTGIGDGEFILELTRNGTVIYSVLSFLRESIQTINMTDTPSAGVYTYALKATLRYDAGMMTNRSIMLLGVKK